MKFSVTGLFKHEFSDSRKVTQFEERTVLVEAASALEAEKLILDEFEKYSQDGTSFTNIFEIYELYPQDGPVEEVASKMKVFAGTEEEFVQRFWSDQKPDSCVLNGWNHSWYNKSVGLSGCYNCLEVRKGELWRDA